MISFNTAAYMKTCCISLDDLQMQSVVAAGCLYYLIPNTRSKPDLTRVITFANVSECSYSS